MERRRVYGQSGIRFRVNRWAAWAPGLTTSEAWTAWASSPFAPAGLDVPSVADVPAMARRRLERLGRLAYFVAASCQGDSRDMPVVFASRHGDVARSVELLSTLAGGETLSPTGFGLSVHNAIGGQYSITRKNPANFVSVAAGSHTAEAGVVESFGLLRDGNPEVLLVVYDVSLPPVYAQYADEPGADFAWAMRLELPGGQEPSLGLAREPRSESANGNPALPHGLDVLRFFLTPRAELLTPAPGGSWVWTHHD